MNLEGKGKKTCFTQPCACFDGSHCRIYEDRPKRCRTFECRLLQRAQQDSASVPGALRKIAVARRRAEAVLQLVRDLGHVDETVPLSRRYAEIMSQPDDLSGDPAQSRRRGELLLAVHELVMVLERDFLT